MILTHIADEHVLTQFEHFDYLHRSNLNCFVVIFVISFLKFEPGHTKPH